MDNKLSELSKPVVWVPKSQLAMVNSGDSVLVEADLCAVQRFNEDPLYSQEYVSALQHESAVNWEAAASLNVENQELKKRIAELEVLLDRNIKRAKKLGELLATPVRSPDDGLDDCRDMWPSDCCDDFDTGYKFGLWRYEQNIRAAGFKVEGGGE